MTTTFKKLWADDRGALLSAEWVFMGTILVIGVTAGLVSVRNGVDAELSEFGNAMTSLNQSYRVPGIGNQETFDGSFSTYAAGSGAKNNSGIAQVNDLRLYGPLAGNIVIDEHLKD